MNGEYLKDNGDNWMNICPLKVSLACKQLLWISSDPQIHIEKRSEQNEQKDWIHYRAMDKLWRQDVIGVKLARTIMFNGSNLKCSVSDNVNARRWGLSVLSIHWRHPSENSKDHMSFYSITKDRDIVLFLFSDCYIVPKMKKASDRNMYWLLSSKLDQNYISCQQQIMNKSCRMVKQSR